MRDLFLGFLALVFVLGLSGVAGAEEWRTAQFKDSVLVMVDLPESYVEQPPKVVKRGAYRIYDYEYIGPTGQMSIGVQKIVPLDPNRGGELKGVNLKGAYPLDRMDKETRTQYLNVLDYQGTPGEFYTLETGIKAIKSDRTVGSNQVKSVFGYTDGVRVSVTVTKKGEMSGEEAELAEQVLKSLYY